MRGHGVLGGSEGDQQIDSKTSVRHALYAGVRNIFKELVQTSIVSLVAKRDMTVGTVTPRGKYFL